MNRKRHNDKALRITSVARQEFANRGFEGARVERIVRLAGVNKQLLFYYFHSKRGLFQAVREQVARELERDLAGLPVPAGRPLARIRRALEVQYDYLARNPDAVSLLVQTPRSDLGSFGPAIKRLVVLIAEGQGLGEVRDDVDPHLVAAQALVLIVGYLKLEGVVAASTPTLGADEPALRERWRHGAVDLVVSGIRAAPTPGASP